jgi:AmiR/NasT family two-component response regulator
MKVPSGATRVSIRVLVADSNQIQSQLVSSALRRQRGMKAIRCRGEVSECIQVLRSASVDIVLLGDTSDHDRLIEALRGSAR